MFLELLRFSQILGLLAIPNSDLHRYCYNEIELREKITSSAVPHICIFCHSQSWRVERYTTGFSSTATFMDDGWIVRNVSFANETTTREWLEIRAHDINRQQKTVGSIYPMTFPPPPTITPMTPQLWTLGFAILHVASPHQNSAVINTAWRRDNLLWLQRTSDAVRTNIQISPNLIDNQSHVQ